ncbi:putative DNA-binding transcriptional regulator YafY [Tamaricihabitans halophyticus]|uniref:Putative DNA-binding transcriptional regulator YafY n=1 Tax=Tamaricihabitans halophyticus TaxID=1262583 RepID=A0A4R2QB39_9PSEU|nr:YafY family protein [Tamaricihabitans halophyticus]TCP45759.1 putative DNA-binding transcriptional regulator YafY [Tamaricihabitans halophyticus]
MPTTSARLLSLLSLLQARRDWPAALLADRLAVSSRTVRRDIDRLRELGYPIATSKGPDGGYRLRAGQDLPPLFFDDEQAIALAVALQLATTASAGIEEAAARALRTVRQVMPSRLRHRIDTMRITAIRDPASERNPQVDAEVLLALSTAVQAREVLRFDYRPVSAARVRDPAAPRRTEPHHLVTWGGRWYLVAWDLDRADWRTFRADRISPRTPTGPRFTPRQLPADDVASFVTSKFSTTGGQPCRGQVILDLPAETVSQYLRDGVVEELTRDRCLLTLSSWSWPGLAATIGMFDADIEVVGPTELGAAFELLAHRCTAAVAH